jgi:hypothetical protein
MVFYWQPSIFVWLCHAANGSHQEVTHLPKFPLHSVLCQISVNKVGFHAEMVGLSIKNTFENNNAAQMKHNSVQKLTNNFFGILCIYANSLAAASSPFSLKIIQ